jgi:hypothetical protein
VKRTKKKPLPSPMDLFICPLFPYRGYSGEKKIFAKDVAKIVLSRVEPCANGKVRRVSIPKEDLQRKTEDGGVIQLEINSYSTEDEIEDWFGAGEFYVHAIDGNNRFIAGRTLAFSPPAEVEYTTVEQLWNHPDRPGGWTLIGTLRTQIDRLVLLDLKRALDCGPTVTAWEKAFENVLRIEHAKITDRCKTCGYAKGMHSIPCQGATQAALAKAQETNAVEHPRHYNSHPSGVECINIVEHFGFNIGNAIKYAWRCGLKGDEIEDLKKGRWYLDREIAKREKERKKP